MAKCGKRDLNSHELISLEINIILIYNILEELSHIRVIIANLLTYLYFAEMAE